MTEPSDRSEARREAAILLGIDIERLTAADSLRVDMVSSLRLVIDSEQAAVLSGNSADLGKLNVAVASLIALLPNRELPTASSGPDPRQVMWETYLGMRQRGGISEHGTLVDSLRAENAQLRAALGGGSTANAVQLCDRSHVSSGRPPAITPTEVVPPGEIAECDPGMRPGPDDPPRRSSQVIEGKAMPARTSLRNEVASAPAEDMVDLRHGYNSDPRPEPWREFCTDVDGVPLSARGKWWGPV